MEVGVSNTCKSMAILVHGTWGVNATWVQEGSPFRKALQQACPDQIEFDVYTWPGKNSPSGRQSAAEGLSIKVEAAVLDRPNVPHFVVGHSHGGNIALRAVELTDAFASAHVVCLSTPFLCVEPRMYDEDLVESTTLSFALWTTAFLGLLWHFGSEGLPVRLRSEPMFIVVAAVFILPATYILGKFLPRWKASAINLAQSVTMKIPSSASVLVLRICGDEAAYAINMAQLLMFPLRYFSDKRKFLQAYADKVEIKFIKIPRRADFIQLRLSQGQ